VATCARCGSFLCGECTEVREDAAWCASCVAWLRVHGQPSRLMRGVLGLQVASLLGLPVGLFCFLPTPLFTLVAAGVGLWLPTRELRRIARGEAPERGRKTARVARGLAWVNLGLGLLWGAGVLWLLWRTGRR
jgi:hypothetical protein